MRRFRVSELPAQGERITLSTQRSHHLLHVMRHPRGAKLVVFDGSGREADAVLLDAAPAAVVQLQSQPRRAAPPHALELVLAILKGPAMDRAIRMATETGATRILPVLTDRVVARGDRGARWARIAESAAQQCGRADLPTLDPPRPLREVGAHVHASDRRVALPGAAPATPATGPAAVAIGPAGGWSPQEVDLLLEQGWSPTGLGQWVLRAETAVAVALSQTAPRP